MFAWLAVGASGGVFLYATQMEKKKLAGLFKLLTMLLLIILLCSHGEELSLSARWVVAGLVFSLAGNLIFLLSNRFYPLAVFVFVLVAICYGKAYWVTLSEPLSFWIPAMLYAALIILFLIGLPYLSGVVLPAIILGSALTQATWAAAEVWLQYNSQPALFGFIGTSLLQSCCIGHAFKHRTLPAKNGNLMLNSAYFIAQALITASVLV
jgi:uncharacterized membrane protein YhhN